jgi:signal transduction histidine kinase
MRRELLVFAIVLVTATVFIADVLTPHDVHMWVLYLPVILAPVWFNRARHVVFLGAASSVLMVVGDYLTVSEAIPHWWDVLNWVMGVTTIWLAVAAGLILCRRSNHLAQLALKLQADSKLRQALEREVLEAAVSEQRRIGQELHDGVGQELTGLGLMANALAIRLPESAPEHRIAFRLRSGLDRVHQQVRTLTKGLVPVPVDGRGLCVALDDLAATASEQSGIPVTFDGPDQVEVLDQSTATDLYRIAQEAVSNALRHGRPSNVFLKLNGEPPCLRLTVQDDGTGFLDRPETARGMGLRIMQYRSEQIGGLLHIGPVAGGGTMVSCELQRDNRYDLQESTIQEIRHPNLDCG